jgi:hypothetical protein
MILVKYTSKYVRQGDCDGVSILNESNRSRASQGSTSGLMHGLQSGKV